MLKSLYSTLFTVEEDPEWLDSLKGENPLLGDSEFKFISQVRSAMKRGPALDECTPPVTRSRNYDIQDFTRNFTELIEHLRMNSYETLFLQTYPEWKMHRADTIVKLKKIANSIDEDKRNCEIATAIGSGMSLIGGLICLFSDQKVQNNTSMMTGSAMMGLGNLATAGTSVIGSILLRENISEAQEAIVKDRERMVNLWKWMKNTEHLLDTMKSIKSIDIGGSLQATAKSLHSISKMNLSSRGALTKVKEVLGSFRCPQEMRGDISDVMGILVTVQMLCDRFSPLIQCAKMGSDISSRLRRSAQLFRSAVGLNNALGASSAVALTSRQRAQVFGGMCLDVTSIVQTYMESNSQSVESQKIQRAIEILRDEGDLFRNLYDEIRGVNHVELRRIV